MKLTTAQKSEIENRIAFAFHARAYATMNTAGQIGQTNFYGDAANPTVSQADVLGMIECALDNWNQPDDLTDTEWLDQVTSDILADVVASEPITTIKIEDINSAGIKAQGRKDGINEVTLLGTFDHPEHGNSNDWRIRVYDFGGVKVADTNGDPVWAESDPEAWAEMMETYETGI